MIEDGETAMAVTIETLTVLSPNGSRRAQEASTSPRERFANFVDERTGPIGRVVGSEREPAGSALEDRVEDGIVPGVADGFDRVNGLGDEGSVWGHGAPPDVLLELPCSDYTAIRRVLYGKATAAWRFRAGRSPC